MSRTYKARIKFRYIPETNQTLLLVKYPGDEYFTDVWTHNGQITHEHAFAFVQRVAELMSKKGYDIIIDSNEHEFD